MQFSTFHKWCLWPEVPDSVPGHGHRHQQWLRVPRRSKCEGKSHLHSGGCPRTY